MDLASSILRIDLHAHRSDDAGSSSTGGGLRSPTLLKPPPSLSPSFYRSPPAALSSPLALSSSHTVARAMSRVVSMPALGRLSLVKRIAESRKEAHVKADAGRRASMRPPATDNSVQHGLSPAQQADHRRMEGFIANLENSRAEAAASMTDVSIVPPQELQQMMAQSRTVSASTGAGRRGSVTSRPGTKGAAAMPLKSSASVAGLGKVSSIRNLSPSVSGPLFATTRSTAVQGDEDLLPAEDERPVSSLRFVAYPKTRLVPLPSDGNNRRSSVGSTLGVPSKGDEVAKASSMRRTLALKAMVDATLRNADAHTLAVETQQRRSTMQQAGNGQWRGFPSCDIPHRFTDHHSKGTQPP
jgi:hypothetical protein